MLKGVHESLQGGWIGNVGLALPHLWQLLHLPCDLSQDLQDIMSALKLDGTCHSKEERHNPELLLLYLFAVCEEPVQLV